MPKPCSTALAGARSARSGTTGSPTSASFGRSSLMNAAMPGSPERAPFFRRFLTICRKLTVSTAILALVAAAAWAGRSWLVGRIRSSEAAPAAPAPATVRVVTLAPEVVVSALHYSAAVKEFEKAELSFRQGGTVESLLQVRGPDGTDAPRPRGGSRAPRLGAGPPRPGGLPTRSGRGRREAGRGRGHAGQGRGGLRAGAEQSPTRRRARPKRGHRQGRGRFAAPDGQNERGGRRGRPPRRGVGPDQAPAGRGQPRLLHAHLAVRGGDGGGAG